MQPADTFATRKAMGDIAEHHLRDLLTQRGAIVEMHQRNRDAAGGGAAVAHLGAGTIHLPDISVTWAQHPVQRFGMECKAKHPLARGGFGWDQRAFDRAARWSEMSGLPVFLAVRDLTAAPLPRIGAADENEIYHWHVASVWKLLHSPNRYSDHHHHYWTGDDFVPLFVLLDGAADITAAMVPCVPAGPGQPPLVL